MSTTRKLQAFKLPERAQRNLESIAAYLDKPVYRTLNKILTPIWKRNADPDRALNNLERLLAKPEAREKLPGLLENDGHGLEDVLQILAVSQFFADTLIAFPQEIERITQPHRRNPSTEDLTQQLKSEVEAAKDDIASLNAFRIFRQLQMLRVGVNDVIHNRPLEEVTRDISRIADASLKIALEVALRTTSAKFGIPTTKQGQPAQIAAFAFGKLGGDELNYSSDIDLMFVYDEDGETTGQRKSTTTNQLYYAKVVTEVVRLLSSHTDRGFAYRVDLRLRPEGQHGPLAIPFTSLLSYYDLRGRTWERQALIKLRSVAGERTFRKKVIAALEPFIYRKYFSFSEINEVKALKRQMEQRATRTGTNDTDVKTGHGGIRDIEFTVQFLQLLNGGDLPTVRQRNTLLALEALEQAGCLTSQESALLSDSYRFLRKTEHHLQVLFDWQTHRLPKDNEDLRTLALRMGYRETELTHESATRSTDTIDPTPALAAQRRSPLDEQPSNLPEVRQLLIDPLEQFLQDYFEKTRLNRAILDHLLHQTFAEAGGQSEPEADMILDPDPDPANVRTILARYGFRDLDTAYSNLNRLAQESGWFLSHRRCRHFFASIAPQVLQALAKTADPDDALKNLEQVTASLGAKAVLYELFSAKPASLRLYVDLCANSPYLSSILMNNAGMEDELLDSLMRDRHRTREEMTAELAELLRGASDPEPIVRSFQDNEFLRIGVLDLLGNSTIRETTASLSDVADTVLNAVFDRIEPKIREKFGKPIAENGDECHYVVMALGKLGGRELSYHSDLDLVLIYESAGMTDGDKSTTNHHYFTELAQKAIRALSTSGPMGKLYEVDMRLRPSGKSGNLVVPIDEFNRYYASGAGQDWERLAITRSRVVRGNNAFAMQTMQVVRRAIACRAWTKQTLANIRGMRERLEQNGSPKSLKRVPGGIIDIEFIVQMMQLKHGAKLPRILQANVWQALESLESEGVFAVERVKVLADGYTFLRTVESRLRLVTDRATTELPDDLEKIARRMGYESTETETAAFRFHQDLKQHMTRVREVYREVAG